MKGFLVIVPFLLVYGHLLAQEIGSISMPMIRCNTQEVVLGVNWHFKEPLFCSDTIYFPFNIFHPFPEGFMNARGLAYWMNYTGPYMFHYKNTDSFNDWVNSGLFHYVGYVIENPICFFLANKYSGFYYIDNSDSILDYSKYRDLKAECDSIFGKGNRIVLSSHQLNIWHRALTQYMDSSEVKTAIKNLDFEKFDNYYPIPISEAWKDTTYDYFKQVSKVFYLLLFKCKITYLEGAYIGFDLPNTNLNLNSDNPEERSFCKRISIPYYPIVNIEDVEPYNPRMENK